MPIPIEKLQRLAGLELNALRAAEVLGKKFEKVRIQPRGTPIYDINGDLLFYRIPLTRGRTFSGYVDIAANEIFGEPLLAVAADAKWNEYLILREARAAARKRREIKFDSIRFVAYSFPKIALQFLQDGKEVLMLEWKSWEEVPGKPSRREPTPPSNFERWSLVKELPGEIKESRIQNFKERLEILENRELRRIDPTTISRRTFDLEFVQPVFADTREIHYSPRAADHHPCYELRGQQTSVWCVAASVEMLLNFYRYQYDQPRLAQELHLGTCASPNGLPYGDEWRVVDTIERLSSNTLNATDIANPGWAIYETEIKANRPLISFIPRHSRTVAGYTRSLISLPGNLPFRGLLVYDPWPPTDCAHPEAGGVITKWENFNTQTYRYAFTAVLSHV
mgnify:CR=1 FL=1